MGRGPTNISKPGGPPGPLPAAGAPAAGSPGEPDPSMDDILASIRRILSDEERAGKSPAPGDDVLKLDPSMMVEDTSEELRNSDHVDIMPVPVLPAEPPAPLPTAERRDDPPVRPMTADAADPAENGRRPGGESLIAPEAAAQAASSVGTLMRTLMSERHAGVFRGGPTIEDLVREEIRPLLKEWLDRHLPDMVERLVRAEIERVVGRTTG